MMSRSLWRGFDPPTTRPLPRSRNRLKESNVHYLFYVRNMFFYYLQDIFCKGTTTDLIALALRSFFLALPSKPMHNPDVALSPPCASGLVPYLVTAFSCTRKPGRSSGCSQPRA